MVNLHADDFDARDLAVGREYQFFLELGIEPDGSQVGFPVRLVNGIKSGNTLVVLAGVHGDEFEGVQAAHEIFEMLEPAKISGRVIVVPNVHLAAHRASQRSSPIDSLNLARTFPGIKDGTATQRIAYYLSEKIICHADFLIDLHSGGNDYLMPTMVGYDASANESGRVSYEAARHLGMPVIWGHKQLGPGRTLCEAARRNIPWLYTESAGGGRVLPDALAYYKRALMSLLQFLKIVPGTLSRSSPDLHLFGDGDLDQAMFAETAGFFAARVNLLDRVDQNQVVGLIRNMFGQTLAVVRAPSAGIVAMLRANPVVSSGDSVCLLAQKVTVS